MRILNVLGTAVCWLMTTLGMLWVWEHPEKIGYRNAAGTITCKVVALSQERSDPNIGAVDVIYTIYAAAQCPEDSFIRARLEKVDKPLGDPETIPLIVKYLGKDLTCVKMRKTAFEDFVAWSEGSGPRSRYFYGYYQYEYELCNVYETS